MKRSSFLIVSLLLLCSGLLGASVLCAADPLASCSDCHREVVEKAKRNRVVHAPFLTAKCAECHVVGLSAKPTVKKSSLVREKQQVEKIRWFRDVHGVAAEHWILLSTDKVGNALFVKAWDGSTRSPLQSLALPRVNTLPEMPSDLQAPTISGVRVPDIRRGISTSVTISWQTDEFTDAEILYGEKGLDSSRYEEKLNKEHRIILVGLDSNTKYQYRIVCRDLFGNRAESKLMTFVTDRTFIEQDSRQDGSRYAGQKIQLDWEVYRSQGRYLLVFKADRAVSLSLGAQQSSFDSKDPVKKQQEVASAVGHPMLKSQLDTNITVCYSCHSSFKDAYSHPVNVFPRSGMKIPDDFPLLPDGRISCMSCHSNHGANYAYRLIREKKSDLCRGCHSEY